MAGFGLGTNVGRIPCPHCGSTDCAGVEWEGDPNEDRSNWWLICCETGRRVTETQLRQQLAKSAGGGAWLHPGITP